MAPGLFLDAFVGVDEQDGGLRVGGAGHHILEEFFVAGCVNDDVLAFGRPEPDLGGINGDVLVALGLQAVHQEGPFERHAAFLARGPDLLEFPVR